MKRKSTYSNYDNRPFKKVRSPLKKPPYRQVGPPRKVYVQTRSTNELKGFDTRIDQVIPTTDLTSNSHIWAMNLAAPGNGSYNRIGKSIFLKSLRLRGEFFFRAHGSPALGSLDEQCLRWSVVWDKSPNAGSYPKWDDIFCNTFYNGDEKAFFDSSLRFDNTGRFQVLKEGYFDSRDLNNGAVTPFIDKTTLMPIDVAPTTRPTQWSQIMFDEYVDLKGKKTIFATQNSEPKIEDISTGALYFIVRQEFGELEDSATHWGINGMTGRIRFTD